MTRMSGVLLAAAVGLLGPLSGVALADMIPMENLPSAVQNTIRNEVGNGRIHEIERDKKDGRTVYEVEWTTSQGDEVEIKVTEDGQVIKREIKSKMK